MSCNETRDLNYSRIRSSHDQSHQDHTQRNPLCWYGHDVECRLPASIILTGGVCECQYESSCEHHAASKGEVQAHDSEADEDDVDEKVSWL